MATGSGHTEEIRVRCAHSLGETNPLEVTHSSPLTFPAAIRPEDAVLHPTHSNEEITCPGKDIRNFYQTPIVPEDAHILPFFPRYEAQWLCDQKLLVAWFEVDFSQATYNFDAANNGSNACTLIAILLSAYSSSERILTTCSHNHISYCIIKALGICMLNGNEIYSSLKRQGALPNMNLSIPEAIHCAADLASNMKEWKSVLYMQPLSNSLYINAKRHVDDWNANTRTKKHSYFYMILIADARSVLFIVNRKDDSITLIDSHQHSPMKGAAIAVVNKSDFKYLCDWFSHVQCKYYQSDPSLYELSFLYSRRK